MKAWVNDLIHKKGDPQSEWCLPGHEEDVRWVDRWDNDTGKLAFGKQLKRHTTSLEWKRENKSAFWVTADVTTKLPFCTVGVYIFTENWQLTTFLRNVMGWCADDNKKRSSVTKPAKSLISSKWWQHIAGCVAIISSSGSQKWSQMISQQWNSLFSQLLWKM